METGYIKFTDIDTNKPTIEVKIVAGTAKNMGVKVEGIDA